MGSRCSQGKSVTRKLNPSGLQRGSDNADHHVQNRSEKVENPSVLVNKNEDDTRAASSCVQVLKGKERIQKFSKESSQRLLSGDPRQDSQRASISKMAVRTIKKNGHRPGLSTSQNNLKGKGKMQKFDKDKPKLPFAGSAGQAQGSLSERENSSKNSAHLVEKNEDHTSTGASTSQKVLIKGKETITRQSVKKKQQAEKVNPKPGPKNHTNKPSRKENPIPTLPYHIFWDGFEESEEEALEQTHRCCLCDINLAYGPIEEEAEEDYEHEHEEYEDQVFARLPEVAVLACGHAFHEQCLLSATPEEFSRDPPCFICASLY